MDDASLDDFVDADRESSDDDDEAAGSPSRAEADSQSRADDAAESTADRDADVHTSDDADAESSDEGVDAEAAADRVEPARSTMTFAPDPGECDGCGESVSRRWTDGDALVCRECKEW